jgi:hypothetical protein
MIAGGQQSETRGRRIPADLGQLRYGKLLVRKHVADGFVAKGCRGAAGTHRFLPLSLRSANARVRGRFRVGILIETRAQS